MLTLSDLKVSYGAIRALRGISLDVQAGELVALIGSNGAGKTTTLRTVSGLLRPLTGKATFEGHDLSRLAPHQIVRMGISHVPEGRQIFGSLSVQHNLHLGAVARKDRISMSDDLERVFALFPVLKQRLRQSGATLSGGEQQMLAIGRALMARPRLLLLDEPSLGLAPLLVERIFESIAQLKAEGTTILLVEQNARQALEVADRGYVLETGRVAIEGPAVELAADPDVERAYLGG